MLTNIKSKISRIFTATALAVAFSLPGAAANAASSLQLADTWFRHLSPTWADGITLVHLGDASVHLVRAAGDAADKAYRNALAEMAAVDAKATTNATPLRTKPLSRLPEQAARAPDVFGSKAIAFRKLPALDKLKASYTPDGRQALIDCGARSCSPAEAQLARTLGTMPETSLAEKAAAVNAAVNSLVAYRKDIDHYRTLDYWATPRETLARQAGDCEDYALLKMALLEELGVAASSMSVVVLKDESRDLFHAILALQTGQGYLVLDNMQDPVLRDRDLPHYAPFYSLSDGRAFIHGRKVGSSKMVASSNLRAIAPGEGPVALEDSANGPTE